MTALNLCKLMGCKYIDKTNDWRKVMGLWVCKYHMKKMVRGE